MYNSCMQIIQLSFTMFLNKIIFYFLVQHISHFLPETFALNIIDVFEKSNERIFSYGNCKFNRNVQSKCLICSHYPLAMFFPILWLFLVLFWMLWMLATVHKPCHLTRASRITTSRTLFTEKFFSVSKEWVRSCSHALW